uniref:Uncharacterized protein n=1 Tax=uncultured bacterium contig00151 TaxID=1181590 RepID=A0A806KKR8_9BACT|nr:hypothetical protein [uncultured bacterium contig00151]
MSPWFPPPCLYNEIYHFFAVLSKLIIVCLGENGMICGVRVENIGFL